MKPPHEKDVAILRSLAEALKENNNWDELIDVATELRPLLSGREINEAIRLEAIALDGLDEFEEAERRYLHVIDDWPNEEVRFRLAIMLIRQERQPEARELLDTLRRNLRRGNSHYRRMNRSWGKDAAAWLKYLDQQAKSA